MLLVESLLIFVLNDVNAGPQVAAARVDSGTTGLAFYSVYMKWIFAMLTHFIHLILYNMGLCYLF